MSTSTPQNCDRLRARLPVKFSSRLLCTFVCCQLVFSGAARDYADLSLEDLLNESVTSVSKKETTLMRSPAAIAVVTNDDMRRLGITSFPEALRWVPGLNVGQISSNIWSVGSRGFGYQYSDKLLVLMDGRSIYTPSFGGVFWDAHDAMLEDIDRIEVIRGPGATLWGANAVNGVINIISKSAKDTQGTLVSMAGGLNEGTQFAVRHGGTLGRDAHYRAYVKGFDRDPLRDVDGNDIDEDWEAVRGGFRVDWTPSPEDAVMVQGDVYSSDVEELFRSNSAEPPFYSVSSVESRSYSINLLGRWTHLLSDASEFSLQSYIDTGRHEGLGTTEYRDTFDIEFQHRIAAIRGHDIVWGAGYRVTADDMRPSENLVWTRQRETLQLATLFVQDEIELIEDRFSVTAGSKFEHNSVTGLEVQPGVRALWTPGQRQTFWGGVSRAVRTPSRANTDAEIRMVSEPFPGSGLFETNLNGNPSLKSEELAAYEIGYRIEPTASLSFDLAGFYNDYDRLVGFAFTEPEFVFEPMPHIVQTGTFENNQTAKTYGGELSALWKATSGWRLNATYSTIRSRIDTEGFGLARISQRQATLRSYLDLPFNLEVNGGASYVSEVASFFPGAPGIPSYVRVDLGLIWHPTEFVELGIWGRNLLDDQHPEADGVTTSQRAEVPRSFMARATLRF